MNHALFDSFEKFAACVRTAMHPQMARLAKRNEVRHVEPELGVLQQSDLFLNQTEALAAATSAAPAQESEPGIDVAPHKRTKRGRKPLDPALPRDIVRHALPEAERFCAHDGTALVDRCRNQRADRCHPTASAGDSASPHQIRLSLL